MKVLVVEDEPEILETTRWALEAAGFEAIAAGTGEEALERFEEAQPEVLLVDYKLPGITGIDFARRAKAAEPQVAVVVITGLTHQSERIEEEARELGACRFLTKPLKMDQVIEIVQGLAN